MNYEELRGGVGGRRLPVRERAVADEEWLRGGTPFQRRAVIELRRLAEHWGIHLEVSTEFQYLYFGPKKPGSPGNPFQIKWYVQTGGDHLRFYLRNASHPERQVLHRRLSSGAELSDTTRGYGFNAHTDGDIQLVKEIIATRLESRRNT